MSRGMGSTQRAVLDVVAAHPEGLAIDTIAGHVYGAKPTSAQIKSLRRAIRALTAANLVARSTRWDSRPRKSLKRFVALTPCEGEYCDSCAQRKRRVRIDAWHRRVMRENAKHDPGWLDDLALADASGFVHATGGDRIVDDRPNTVDQCQRRLQFISPARRNLSGAA